MKKVMDLEKIKMACTNNHDAASMIPDVITIDPNFGKFMKQWKSFYLYNIHEFGGNGLINKVHLFGRFKYIAIQSYLRTLLQINIEEVDKILLSWFQKKYLVSKRDGIVSLTKESIDYFYDFVDIDHKPAEKRICVDNGEVMPLSPDGERIYQSLIQHWKEIANITPSPSNVVSVQAMMNCQRPCKSHVYQIIGGIIGMEKQNFYHLLSQISDCCDTMTNASRIIIHNGHVRLGLKGIDDFLAYQKTLDTSLDVDECKKWATIIHPKLNDVSISEPSIQEPSIPEVPVQIAVKDVPIVPEMPSVEKEKISIFDIMNRNMDFILKHTNKQVYGQLLRWTIRRDEKRVTAFLQHLLTMAKEEETNLANQLAQVVDQ